MWTRVTKARRRTRSAATPPPTAIPAAAKAVSARSWCGRFFFFLLRSDGIAVGDGVGSAVGDGLGNEIGSAEGRYVALGRVAFAVGALDVGAAVGAVGAGIGRGLGVREGVGDGAAAGVDDGAAADAGAAVGTTAGAAEHPQVRAHADDALLPSAPTTPQRESASRETQAQSFAGAADLYQDALSSHHVGAAVGVARALTTSRNSCGRHRNIVPSRE